MRRVILRRKAILGVTALALLLAATFQSPTSAQTTIRLWTFLDPSGTDPRGMVLRAIVEAFNAAGRRTRVLVESIHWQRIDNQVIQATAAGAGPDVIDIYSNQLRMHVEAGTVVPLDARAKGWYERNYDTMVPWERLVYRGHVWGLPWEQRVWLLWYRKDLLERATLPVPTTLENLADAAAKLGTEGQIGFAVGLSEGQLGAAFVETFMELLWAAGGDMFDTTGRAVFDSPAGVRAMSWLRELARRGGIPRTAVTMTADDILSAVQAGSVAMTFQGSMRVSAARRGLGGKGVLGTAVIPGFHGLARPAPPQTPIRVLSIGSTSKYPDDAWSFIEFYVEKKWQRRWASVGVLPVNASVYEDLPEEGRQELLMWRDYARRQGKLVWFPPDFNELSERLARTAQMIVFGTADPQRALAEVAAWYNARKK